MTTQIVTRFAPSPTGFLHIGGARTALFNWLFAKHSNGLFRLRIEDTDRERSTPEATKAILEGLGWLGLDWDGDPVYQSERAARHRELAEQLLAEGRAYRCYASAEELAEMRERARAEGRAPRYDGRWRDRDPAEAPEGVAPAIRLKAETAGETVVRDRVQGDVVFRNDQLDDLILLRSDGTPTYMLAVVADDHDMGVTHVIRGDDHLNNAARQMQILAALGWEPPVYAHVPLIHGADGAKLSKRHGALGVEAYRDMGYLPEALRNYLLRLGWSHGDDEIISTEQAIEWFSLEGLGKAAARLDLAKLESVNAHYMKHADDLRLVKLTLKAREATGEPLGLEDEKRLERAMPALKTRAKTVPELTAEAAFLWLSRPIAVTGKPAKALDEAARARLAGLVSKLEASDWTPEALENAIRAFAESEGVGFGKVGQPLRAALTGGLPAPGLGDALFALGADEALARIRDQAG